jgi:hypothetical protein
MPPPAALSHRLCYHQVVSDVELPFVTESFVGVGQTVTFDPVSGHVIATGRLTPTGNHSILLVDPVKGTHTQLAQIGFGDVLGCVAPPMASEWGPCRSCCPAQPCSPLLPTKHMGVVSIP